MLVRSLDATTPCSRRSASSCPGGKASVMTANPCDACDGTRFRLIYPFHPVLDGPLVRCEGCGLVQVNPPRGRYQIADAAGHPARAAAYAEQAAAVRATLQYRPEIEEAERAVRERCWAERLARIERVAPRGRLLEIGSDGQFLRLAAANGWSVTGVQPDAGTCANAAALYGLELISATLGEVGFPDRSFDVVAMFHVIEHVPAPLERPRHVDQAGRHRPRDRPPPEHVIARHGVVPPGAASARKSASYRFVTDSHV